MWHFFHLNIIVIVIVAKLGEVSAIENNRSYNICSLEGRRKDRKKERKRQTDTVSVYMLKENGTSSSLIQ